MLLVVRAGEALRNWAISAFFCLDSVGGGWGSWNNHPRDEGLSQGMPNLEHPAQWDGGHPVRYRLSFSGD